MRMGGGNDVKKIIIERTGQDSDGTIIYNLKLDDIVVNKNVEVSKVLSCEAFVNPELFNKLLSIYKNNNIIIDFDGIDIINPIISKINDKPGIYISARIPIFDSSLQHNDLTIVVAYGEQ